MDGTWHNINGFHSFFVFSDDGYFIVGVRAKDPILVKFVCKETKEDAQQFLDDIMDGINISDMIKIIEKPTKELK